VLEVILGSSRGGELIPFYPHIDMDVILVKRLGMAHTRYARTCSTQIKQPKTKMVGSVS